MDVTIGDDAVDWLNWEGITTHGDVAVVVVDEDDDDDAAVWE